LAVMALCAIRLAIGSIFTAIGERLILAKVDRAFVRPYIRSN